MGSLVPGWNSVSHLPPIDLRNSYDEEDEPKGYFAKLQKRRSLRRTSPESPTGAPDLQRKSAPLPVESWSPRARDSLFGQPSSPVELRRPSHTEWGGTDTFDVGSAPVTSAWKMKSSNSSSAPRDHSMRWWKKLSSGHLNEAYDDEYAEKDKSTSYTPQYTVTGQTFNYRVEQEGAAGSATIEAENDVQSATRDQTTTEELKHAQT